MPRSIDECRTIEVMQHRLHNDTVQSANNAVVTDTRTEAQKQADLQAALAQQARDLSALSKGTRTIEANK